VTKRYRCIRCRSRIDIDLYLCPACGEEAPLRYLRSRRVKMTIILSLAVAAAVAASAWMLLA